MVLRLFYICGLMVSFLVCAQTPPHSKVLTVESSSNELPDSIHPVKWIDGQVHIEIGGNLYAELMTPVPFHRGNFEGRAVATATGIVFDFGLPDFHGRLYYGFIAYDDSKHPQPVYYKKSAAIKAGKAEIIIAGVLVGDHDMVHWQEKGFGVLGFRVTNHVGNMIYDGRVAFSGKGPFEIVPTVVEGPLVHLAKPHSMTISLETDMDVLCTLVIGEKEIKDKIPTKRHVYNITELEPDTVYVYTVKFGKHSETYSFRTSPLEGSKKRFVFGYASDSRGGNGGGERDIYGTNAYVIKKIMALASYKKTAFMQFSGDLIDGYLRDGDETRLQYRNFKRVVEPFGHYFPIYFSMGNHEVIMKNFLVDGKRVSIDQFPFGSHSAEAVFAGEFIQPENGPNSEDGSRWDPNPAKQDFPSYNENVFSYTYANTAVVVLNSDYWYAPFISKRPESGGNLHGYIMDNQLAWLKKTLHDFEENSGIDHVFVTLHTPFFPNGGHLRDDMWYFGSNQPRPTIAGVPVAKGIIERRDELLDVIVNQSSKTVAILTGDEHNYCKTKICEEMGRYPKNYQPEKLTLNRAIYQINNGAAGAPYYAQEKTLWSEFTSGFTTQNALVLFEVEGDSVSMHVMNPDTLETIDRLVLR